MVASVQLPTGDENDWLGTEPDIDEAAITETWDTDIVIVGAGNGGMCAAAYAAQNGLDFRVIEQNSSVMETRHWYGTIDSSEAQKKGIAPVDRAELLSEISRSMGGRCDQRVVKTWINESAAMHDFVSGILENEPYNYVCNLTSGDEAKWPDDTQVSQSKLMFLCSRSITAAPKSPATWCSRSTLRAKATASTLTQALPSWKRMPTAASPA